MKRFKVGDLAVTHSLLAPMNNGRIVRILAVIGPAPKWKLPFAYRIKMIDGSLFVQQTESGVPTIGAGITQTDHSNLRPLADKFRAARRKAREPAPVD